MATGKKITLQDKGNNTLYPVTIDQQVLVKDASNVTHTLKETVEFFAGKLKGIEGGTIKVGAASQADNAANATNAIKASSASVADTIKDTNTGANKTWSDIDSLATAAAGTQWTDVGKVYVDQKISDLVAGDVTISIPQASEQDYGVSRLATLYDVQSQNDSSSNDASVAVTPNTLWRYLQSVKGENSGIASLDETGKVPSSQLPSYVDDVLEFANKAAFPTTGEGSKIYIDLATNKVYRWGGSTYVEVSSPLATGETTGTAYDGAKGKANADAISALQTRVSTAEGGITSINGEITKLKTKDESHDSGLQNLDTNKADKTTVTNLQNKVNGIETTTNANNTKLTNIIGTGNPDTDYGDSNTTQSVALAVRAIADDEGKQISTTYAKKADLDNKLDKTGKAASATTADSATKATKDGNDNVITATYATKTELNGKYTKPSTGIPKSDLASAVQTSLGKADTALQTHQDISGKLDITTAANTYLSKTDASNTYALKTELINLTYTVGEDVTY